MPNKKIELFPFDKITTICILLKFKYAFYAVYLDTHLIGLLN